MNFTTTPALALAPTGGTITTARRTDGTIESITYRDEAGRLHREDGPAMTEYDEAGIVRAIEYRTHGELHNTDAPAWVHYNEFGVATAQGWHVNGIMHREDGPAYVWQDPATGERVEEYYFHGEQVTRAFLSERLKARLAMAA